MLFLDRLDQQGEIWVTTTAPPPHPHPAIDLLPIPQVLLTGGNIYIIIQVNIYNDIVHNPDMDFCKRNVERTRMRMEYPWLRYRKSKAGPGGPLGARGAFRGQGGF